MRTQDRGSRIEDREAGSVEPYTEFSTQSSILNPQSSSDPVFRRLRWRCRRGLLELDIVLGRFVECYAALDEEHRRVFDELLDLPDTTLWDMISGKTAVARDEQRALLAIINAA